MFDVLPVLLGPKLGTRLFLLSSKLASYSDPLKNLILRCQRMCTQQNRSFITEQSIFNRIEPDQCAGNSVV